jgi:putative component of toxin-antitoxin plasmid stabilization module
MTAHAKLSASGAHRWMACPGSIVAEAGLPDRPSAHAAEGTAAHSLAEECIRHGKSPFDQVGVTFEMAVAVQQYLDYICDLPGAVEVEQRVEFGRWIPNGFGTVDAVSVHEGVIRVVDLKYGKGVRVDAERNRQLMLYALGAYDERCLLDDIREAVLVIVQPRLDHISEWRLPIAELLAFGDEAAAAAKRALAHDAERIPGESQCRFCKAKPTCPALLQLTHDVIAEDFDALPGIQALDDAQLGQVLTHKAMILDWLSSVEDHVTEQLLTGKVVPGWKLVEGRSLRQWSSERDAGVVLESLIGDKAWERTLLSPAKAEKAVGKAKAQLQDLIVKPVGKPTLAPESDKRQAIQPTGDDFDNLTISTD